jgi:hypothetical protein
MRAEETTLAPQLDYWKNRDTSTLKLVGKCTENTPNMAAHNLKI